MFNLFLLILYRVKEKTYFLVSEEVYYENFSFRLLKFIFYFFIHLTCPYLSRPNKYACIIKLMVSSQKIKHLRPIPSAAVRCHIASFMLILTCDSNYFALSNCTFHGASKVSDQMSSQTVSNCMNLKKIQNIHIFEWKIFMMLNYLTTI